MQTPTQTTHPQRTKCEIYTRVMGYYRPVSHFNIGKKSEFYSRNYFQQPQHINCTQDSKTPALNTQK